MPVLIGVNEDGSMGVKSGFYQPPFRRRVITARRYATALYAIMLCPSLSVRPSQVGKSTKVAKHRMTKTTPYDSPRNLIKLSDAENIGGIPTESTPPGARIRWGKLNRRFSSSISLYLRHGDVVSMES